MNNHKLAYAGTHIDKAQRLLMMCECRDHQSNREEDARVILSELADASHLLEEWLEASIMDAATR